MKILAEEAHIKTASVEIKSLTVSGKQVTLAVFRQLQEEYCFDKEGKPLGVLWGTVNYCPGEKHCKGGWRHIHIVWQKEQELRRCAFKEELDIHRWPAYELEWDNEFEINKKMPLKNHLSYYFPKNPEDPQEWQWFLSSLNEDVKEDPYYSGRLRQAEELFTEYKKWSEEASSISRRLTKERDKAKASHENNLKVIKGLPQLFIAV